MSALALKVASSWPWLRQIGAAAVGAVALVALGRVTASAEGSCFILCNPPVAALFGAVMGWSFLGGAQKPEAPPGLPLPPSAGDVVPPP